MTRRRVNINLDPDVSLSQKEHCLQLMQAGVVLFPKRAEHMVGTTKLATRISELIDEGHTEIVKEYIKVRCRRNKKGKTWTRVMSYRIPEDKQPAV